MNKKIFGKNIKSAIWNEHKTFIVEFDINNEININMNNIVKSKKIERCIVSRWEEV